MIDSRQRLNALPVFQLTITMSSVGSLIKAFLLGLRARVLQTCHRRFLASLFAFWSVLATGRTETPGEAERPWRGALSGGVWVLAHVRVADALVSWALMGGTGFN